MRIGRRFLSGVMILLAGLGAASLRAAGEALDGLDFGSLEAPPVTVYLPPGGVRPTTPVLLALDGQNMPAWRLEEALARVADRGRRASPLVVAIPSGKDRIDEYGLAGALDFGGRGKRAAEFQRFLVERVLPAVRARYGISPDPARTGVMGSSLGGLAAFDLAWRYPGTFGFAGILSGSFWWRGEDGPVAVKQASRLAHRQVRTSPPRPVTQHLWFSVGTKEETDDRDGNGVIDAVQDTTELLDELERQGWKRGKDFQYVLVEGGEHNEAAWAKVLPDFLDWALPAH